VAVWAGNAAGRTARIIIRILRNLMVLGAIYTVDI
jgi:hypothetical protein